MRDLGDLSHTSVRFGKNSEVLVLDTGALIDPEAQAMLGALHSRSAEGIRQHLEVLKKKGASGFMSNFYVGYGHKSIGDLGAVSIFIEGVSMLAAKAIQDFPLYNGQEVSTRYVDFAKREFIDPVGVPLSGEILEHLREFYLQGLEKLVPAFMNRFPKLGDESEKAYEKAIKAYAFDVMRSFLPAGASTNLVWFGELRQIGDRLPVLRNHPLDEVRHIANAIEDALLQKYPSSFPPKGKRYMDTELYHLRMNELYNYYDVKFLGNDFIFEEDNVSDELLIEYREAFETRPPKTELPFCVRDCGTMRVSFPLDFGSFRDLQRQRAVMIRMPLLSMRHGFEEWYLNEMTEEVRNKAIRILASHMKDVESLKLPSELAQYYLPMGYKTPIRMVGDLRGLVYLTELRATRFVHATLRVRAKELGETLLERYGPYGLTLHLDAEPNRFDVRRGEQDIVLKE